MDGFWIGLVVALIAVMSVLFRKNRRTNKVIFLIGLVAAVIGIVAYMFLGWRF
ncbi:hypothetical protein [Pontibacillus yanchengensis]|uniref:hypothetical protein n=1 Tax=Pontibacillus yanchengensis TaxID=462910 RepID=UPI000ADB0CCA|nr:hypothetical protein [Pontibacillus yanchengensis]